MTKVIHLEHKKKSCSCSSKHSPKAGQLDTLVQLGTKKQNEDKISLIQSTTIHDKDKLKKRANRKYLSQALNLGLVDAAKANEKSKLANYYWRSWHCNAVLNVFSDGRISGRFCNTRSCQMCAAIRTANFITKYEPIISTWDNSYLVTLTIPNMSAEELKDEIVKMYSTFVKVKAKLKKREQRNGAPKFVGIRSLECTYNAITDTYHPHFHLLVKDRLNAHLLLQAWLKEYPTAKRSAQDIKKADRNIPTELFKYFTKVVTESKKGRVIRTAPLDIIFNAIYKKRTTQSFGFKLPKTIEAQKDKTKLFGIAQATWIQELGDWANVQTGELISGNIPSEALTQLVTKKVILK